ncbi:hypothetical protein BDW62DRAFT_203305 [Aspergillus aurantiobrunneus]
MAPLKIIGAGYGRTGTVALLTSFANSCHHMEKMLLDETQDRDPSVFKEAYQTQSPQDWGGIFTGYAAAVDRAAAAFWEDLHDREAGRAAQLR